MTLLSAESSAPQFSPKVITHTQFLFKTVFLASSQLSTTPHLVLDSSCRNHLRWCYTAVNNREQFPNEGQQGHTQEWTLLNSVGKVLRRNGAGTTVWGGNAGAIQCGAALCPRLQSPFGAANYRSLLQYFFNNSWLEISELGSIYQPNRYQTFL